MTGKVKMQKEKPIGINAIDIPFGKMGQSVDNPELFVLRLDAKTCLIKSSVDNSLFTKAVDLCVNKYFVMPEGTELTIIT